MLKESLRQLRREAKQLGITWQDVVMTKDHLIELEREQREGTDGVRYRCWELYLAFVGRERTGSIGFWRCGWDRVRSRLENSGRDFTHVPRYDEIASAVRCEYPEWQERETAELFEFLFEPYVPWPSRQEFYEEALEVVVESIDPCAEKEVPF